MIEILAGAHNLHKLRVGMSGGKTILRSQVTGDEGTEMLSTRQVVGSVHLLWLPQEGVAAHSIARLGVAVVASASRIDKIAAKTHLSIVLTGEVERNRRDLITDSDALSISSFISIALGMNGYSQTGDCDNYT